MNGNPIEVPSSLPAIDGPRVSVVVPTYECNHGYIQQALLSVAEQTYTNVEVVFGDRSNDPQLRATAEATDWIHHVPVDRPGVSAGYNEAIQAATGSIYSILNDDDYYPPKRLERQIEALDGGADFVYGDVVDHFPGGGTEYRESMTIDDPPTHWIKFFRFDGLRGTIPSSSVAFRADCVGSSPFDEAIRGGEDYDLWIRILNSHRPVRIQAPLAHMRQRSDSLSSNPDLMFEHRMAAIEKLCDRFPTLQTYRTERERVEVHDYARRLLAASRVRQARTLLKQEFLEHRYPPAALFYLVSFLPAGHGRVLALLDALHDRLSTLSTFPRK